MCSKNRADIEEITPEYLKGLNFHYVDTMKQVLDIAITGEKVNDAVEIV